MTLLIIIGLFVLLSFLSKYYQCLVGRFSILRKFLWLGIFIHEFSHYLACKLMLAKVINAKIGLQQGHVTHQKSKIPIIGSLIISLAPLIIGILLLIWLNYWMFRMNYFDIQYVINKGINLGEQFPFVWREIKWNILSWKFPVYLFLVYNILATFVPSKQDYKNIIWGILLYIILSLIFVDFFEVINLTLIYALGFGVVLIISGILVLKILAIFKL